MRREGVRREGVRRERLGGRGRWRGGRERVEGREGEWEEGRSEEGGGGGIDKRQGKRSGEWRGKDCSYTTQQSSPQTHDNLASILTAGAVPSLPLV